MRFLLFFYCVVSFLTSDAISSGLEWKGGPLAGSGAVQGQKERKGMATTDPILRMEQIIADDRRDSTGKFLVDHSETLRSIMIDAPIRKEPATEREFLIEIQAWDYLARNSRGWEEAIRNALNDHIQRERKEKAKSADSAIQVRLTHYSLSRIAFDYLLARLPKKEKLDEENAKSLAQRIYTQINIAPDFSRAFFEKIEEALTKIAGDHNRDTFEVKEIIPTGNPLSLQGRYNSRDYQTTQRLVTFMFDKNNNVTGCINPTMDEFKGNPFAIYQRPVPRREGGTKGIYAKDYLRINNLPPFLYLILLTDGDTNIVYGLPNPAHLINVPTSEEMVAGGYRTKEWPGRLIQLSRGNPTETLLRQVENVERFITNNNYMLPPVQLMNQGVDGPLTAGELLTFEHHAAFESKGGGIGTQPKVCLGGVYIPTLNFLVADQMFMPSEKIEGKDRTIPVREIVFLGDDNSKIERVDNISVPIAYFRDKQVDTEYTTMHNKNEWPRFFLIKSSEDGKPRSTPQLRDLYVTQMLYRYIPKTGTLIQESMGVPEPSIIWRRKMLEEAIKRNDVRLQLPD